MPADCASVAAVRPDGSIDAGAVNRVLAFRIYKHLAARDTPKDLKNFIFSPLALELTLAKLMRSLDRSDARRIARTVCLPEPPPESFVKGLEAEIVRWKALRADKQPNSKGIDLTLETRAFGTALPAALHGFESESVDPTSKPGSKRIEQWLRTVTGAKARSMVQPIMSPSVVADAVAFEGDLEMPFWNRGRRVPFELDSGITISVAGYENGRVDLRHGDPWAKLSTWATTFPYVRGELNLFFFGIKRDRRASSCSRQRLTRSSCSSRSRHHTRRRLEPQLRNTSWASHSGSCTGSPEGSMRQTDHTLDHSTETHEGSVTRRIPEPPCNQ